MNHLGSGALLALAALLVMLLLPPAFGLAVNWRPMTTPSRLVAHPFIAWSLIAILGIGLALIRAGTLLHQCTSALVLVGLVHGLAIASALFWDPWLSVVLVVAAVPMLRAATKTLKTLGRHDGIDPQVVRRDA